MSEEGSVEVFLYVSPTLSVSLIPERSWSDIRRAQQGDSILRDEAMNHEVATEERPWGGSRGVQVTKKSRE